MTELFQISLDSNAYENFMVLLDTALSTLSQILEMSTLNEMGRMSEEILGYLQSTFALKPTATVKCVHQLLKSLFGTNLVSNADILDLSTSDESKVTLIIFLLCTYICEFSLFTNL